MTTPEDHCDPDFDWIGCEAMLSVPAFGLQPTGPADAACCDDRTTTRWEADQSLSPLAAAPGLSFC